MQKFIEKHYKKIILLILGFMAIVSIFNAKNDSAIFDETAHIGAAYSYLNQHEMRLNPEHPPLIKNLAGFPLLFLDLNFDTNQPFWTGDLPKKWDQGQWIAGKDLLFNFGNDADKIIFWSRLPIVLLSLLLGWFIFKWASETAGILTGLFALILYAFNPNILGHNHFVTTDLGIAAFFVFSFYYYFKFIKDPSWKNVIIAGIFLGLLQLTKFSFIIGLPILALATLVYPLVKIPRNFRENIWKFRFKKLGEYVGKGALALLISIVVVWSGYFLNTFKMSEEIISEQIDFNFSPSDTNIKTIYTNKTLHWLNGNSLTRPLAVYGEGIGYVFRRVSGGNGAYFMQNVSNQASPAYFPTVFVLKEPLAGLFFIFLALIISLSTGIKSIVRKFSDIGNKKIGFASFIRHNIVSISLLAFIILYSYVSITGNLNIGFRHLFPLLPFAYILTAKIIFDFLKKINENSRLIWYLVIAFMSISLISETIATYPYHMSYFNQLAGGSKKGFHFVTDSNADWGQDLKRLKKWVEEHNADLFPPITQDEFALEISKPIEKIRLDYFGGADTKYYFGDQKVDWWDSKRPIETGWYAISTNYLMGSIYDATKKDNESYRWIQNISPVAQVGTSIFVYYITEKELNEIIE